ncbi:hypothetical protein ACSAMZ_13365 [Xanthomonas citri pv. bilvae]|uniref:hypothetical protein n=1 Tax=Xanthomonas citri TaxID=346 RepID=UPI00406A428A
MAVARWPVRVSPCLSARRTQAAQAPAVPADVAALERSHRRRCGPASSAPCVRVGFFQLLGTSTFPHGISYYTPNVQMASLDHALWFHRPFRTDDWLLYSLDSPTAQGARGLARGQFFTRDGVLVASTTQEGLIRVVPDGSAIAVPAKE